MPPGTYGVSAYYTVAGHATIEVKHQVVVHGGEGVEVPLFIETERWGRWIAEPASWRLTITRAEHWGRVARSNPQPGPSRPGLEDRCRIASTCSRASSTAPP